MQYTYCIAVNKNIVGLVHSICQLKFCFFSLFLILFNHHHHYNIFIFAFLTFFNLIIHFLSFCLNQNPFLIVVVLLISSGLFMFTFKSTQFNLEGFILVLLASFLGGIRWTLTQVLMQKAELGEYCVTDILFCLYSNASMMFYTYTPCFNCQLERIDS